MNSMLFFSFFQAFFQNEWTERRIGVIYEGMRGESEQIYKGLVTMATPLQLLAYGNIMKLLPNDVALGRMEAKDECPRLELPYNGDSGIDFFLVRLFIELYHAFLTSYQTFGLSRTFLSD